MSAELTNALVRILAPNGETAGTGFVASDQGLIVTKTIVRAWFDYTTFARPYGA